MSIYICDILQLVHGCVHIGLPRGEWVRLDSAARGEDDVDMLFHRVDNAYVYRWTISFRRVDLWRLYRLREKANDLQCQIEILRILDITDAIDYALVDFLGVHLKPRVYNLSTSGQLRQDYATLFKHDSLRGNLKHLHYNVS